MNEEKNIFLKHLIEDEKTELKSSFDKLPASFWETYSSFANTDGGIIYLGIKEKKNGENEIIGINNVSQIQKDIFDTANNQNKVSKNLLNSNDVKRIVIDDKDVLEVHIRKAELFEKPIYLDGNPLHAYRRDGESDHLLSEIEIKSLFAMNIPASQSLDFSICLLNLSIDDLNQESLNDYRALYNSINKGNIFESYSNEEFFRTIGVLKKENNRYLVTNAGLLVFGNSFQIKTCFPNFFLDYIFSDGINNKWIERLVSDDSTWSGNLYKFVRMVSGYLNANVTGPYYLMNGINVGKTLVYDSIREAFLNAIFNTDFSLPGGIKIVVTPNEAVIRNPGYLMVPLSRAIQGGFSNPRNSSIATIFRSIQYGDRAGTGIPTMFRNLDLVKYPEPIYIEDKTLIATEVRIILLPIINEEGMILREIVKNRDFISIDELIKNTNLSRKKVVSIIDSLLSKGLIVDNKRKTKGRKFKKSWISI